MDMINLQTLKHELQAELTSLKKRCCTIESLLRNLDDYEQPLSATLETSPIQEITQDSCESSQDGQTAMQRTSSVLSKTIDPFTLVQLKEKVNEDGFNKITRSNWGVIVQKLKKKKLIIISSGEEGKPGALYKRVSSI